MRAAFLGQTVRQLHELASLLGGPGDTADAVASELQRIGETAQSFGLTRVEEASKATVMLLESRSPGVGLAGLAKALRASGGHSRFPPIVLIAKEPLLSKLSVEAVRCCETLEFYDSVASWHARLRCEQPEAIVVPLDELDKLEDEDHAASVFVYGGSGYDVKARVHAAARGAKGLLPDRVEFRPLLDRLRALGYRRRAGHPRVLLALDDKALTSALIKPLENNGAFVATAKKPESVGSELREASPDLFVISEQLGTFDAATLVAATRMVPRQADMLVVAVASVKATTPLLTSGCDGVIDKALPAGEIAVQIEAFLDRARSRSTGRDASTGLADRPASLRSVDRALSEARRGGRPLSVAIVELDSAADIQRRLGRGVGDTALRLLARCLEGAIRASDVVGRLDEDSFVVLMPSCSVDHARKRLGDVRSLFTALCARDDKLSGLTFSAGVADTEDGTDRLLPRAEEALERGRARDSRGTIN
jgi:diguanylate cyclase (GGDEF)-like protein